MTAGAASVVAVAAAALLAWSPAVLTKDEPATDAGPAIQDLGEQRYRIGRVTVDKGARSFTVPGRVIHLSGPMEYVAVTEGGMKEYESVLELGASATEFQLACILIGLDDANSVKPRYQFDDREAEGQAVDIVIAWERDGKTHRTKAANALLQGDEPFDDHDWVYIGSNTQQDGELMAEMVGTLIGLVHDPDAIIEHRRGAGIGAYGMITANPGLLPPEGAPVTVSVSAITEAGGEDSKDESTGE